MSNVCEKRWGKATLVALSLVLSLSASGCSRAVSGTAVAPAGVAEEAAMLSTSCKAYISMNQAARRKVIVAIGDSGNTLVAGNPDLWVGLAAALCAFTKGDVQVKDVVTGGIR